MRPPNCIFRPSSWGKGTWTPSAEPPIWSTPRKTTKLSSSGLSSLRTLPLAAICCGKAHSRRSASVTMEQALNLARKAKEANPDDFRASLLLVRMLIANQRQVEAEKELRAAVNANPSDPDRWFVLLQFLTLTKQLEKAETAVHDAESAHQG